MILFSDKLCEKDNESRAKEPQKTAEAKQTCKLFKQVDYVEGGSTRDLQPEAEINENVKDTADKAQTKMDSTSDLQPVGEISEDVKDTADESQRKIQPE